MYFLTFIVTSSTCLLIVQKLLKLFHNVKFEKKEKKGKEGGGVV